MQQHGHVKTPAHQPEGIGWSFLLLQQVSEKRMVVLALAVGDHLGGSQLRQQPSRLQRNTQPTTTKTGSGARHQNPDGSE